MSKVIKECETNLQTQNESANVVHFFDREAEIQTEFYNALKVPIMQQASD